MNLKRQRSTKRRSTNTGASEDTRGSAWSDDAPAVATVSAPVALPTPVEANGFSEKIKLGMTEEDVIDKLGKPCHQEAWESCLFWQSSAGEMYVAFHENEVVGYRYSVRENGSGSSGGWGIGCPEPDTR